MPYDRHGNIPPALVASRCAEYHDDHLDECLLFRLLSLLSPSHNSEMLFAEF